MTTTGWPSRKPVPFRPSTTRRRAAPSILLSGARRSGCSTNPMNSSPGRELRWRQRGGLRRSEKRRHQGESQSVDHEAALIPELLAQDSFFQAVAGVEQHPHRNGLVRDHLDAADIARLVMVGDRRDRALFALEHFDDDKGGVREQGAAPAPRAEG